MRSLRGQTSDSHSFDRRWARPSAALVIGLVLAMAAPGAAATQGAPELSSGGYSIFDETMVDLSYDQVEAAAEAGAVVLWPLGVIEEHGPHLPLGTDIYNSTLKMKLVARLLRERQLPVLVAPPLYWGINEATGAFGGSFILRPSTLESLIEDTFWSLRKDGFKGVYLITGHGDRLHNETIVEAVRKARASTGLRGFVILGDRMRQRLGLDGSEDHVLAVPDPYAGSAGSDPPRHIEVHAGAGETSVVWRFFPELVDVEKLRTLEPTHYGVEDLREWRRGWDDARAKTPLGYFGDPAAADPERGEEAFRRDAQAMADAIAEHVEDSLWSQGAAH